MEGIVLKTGNLTKKYNNYNAVNNVNITVKQGDIYGLVGKNGAGKTTLIRMICGLSMPTSGQIELFNETSAQGLSAARTRTGCIIETPSFFPYLSAKKNLEYYRIQRGIEDKKIVDDALKFVGLDSVGKKNFKNFSLGMKQRLGLALALMASPELLILDEPINGLDPTGIVEFRNILLKLNKERNTTIIISSHILSELSQIATVYGFINNGQLVEQISAQDLLDKCTSSLLMKVDNTDKACAVIREQLGCSRMEVLEDNQIRLFELLDSPEIVVETLVKNGVKLYMINQMGSNLENYFIELVGGEYHA